MRAESGEYGYGDSGSGDWGIGDQGIRQFGWPSEYRLRRKTPEIYWFSLAERARRAERSIRKGILQLESWGGLRVRWLTSLIHSPSSPTPQRCLGHKKDAGEDLGSGWNNRSHESCCKYQPSRSPYAEPRPARLTSRLDVRSKPALIAPQLRTETLFPCKQQGTQKTAIP